MTLGTKRRISSTARACSLPFALRRPITPRQGSGAGPVSADRLLHTQAGCVSEYMRGMNRLTIGRRRPCAATLLACGEGPPSRQHRHSSPRSLPGRNVLHVVERLQQDRSVPLPYAQRVGTLIFDADCGFCTRSAQWLQHDDGIEIQAWQFIDDLNEVGLNEQMVAEAAHWLEQGAVVASGSDAIGRALIARGGIYRTAGRFIVAAPIRPFARGVYKIIARNRHKMPGGTAACRISTN